MSYSYASGSDPDETVERICCCIDVQGATSKRYKYRCWKPYRSEKYMVRVFILLVALFVTAVMALLGGVGLIVFDAYDTPTEVACSYSDKLASNTTCVVDGVIFACIEQMYKYECDDKSTYNYTRKYSADLPDEFYTEPPAVFTGCRIEIEQPNNANCTDVTDVITEFAIPYKISRMMMTSGIAFFMLTVICLVFHEPCGPW